MGRTMTFYRALGLQIPDGAENEPHVEVILAGGMRLMWDPVSTVTSFDPGWTPPTGGHRAALAFSCADAAEVDTTYANMVAKGFDGHKQPWDAFWGQRYALLRDPDGNGVDLYAPLT